MATKMLYVLLVYILLWKPAVPFRGRPSIQRNDDNERRRYAAETKCNAAGEEGFRICYDIQLRESSELLGYDCENPPQVMEDFTQSLDIIGVRTRMFSTPNYPNNYPNNILCLYNVSPCPNSTDLQMLMWQDSAFQLEATNLHFFNPFCSDLVELVQVHTSRRDLMRAGIELERSSRRRSILCGDQCEADWFWSGRTTQVKFLSGRADQAKGFQMSIVCAPPPPGMAGSPGPGGPPRGPPPPDDPIIPRSGDRVEVPSEFFLTYRSNRLAIVRANMSELRVFENITRLFFWTGFTGTRTFIASAPLPLEEIFGGGTLIIVNNCAYYATFNIPQRFVPTVPEREVLTVILRALSVFFNITSPDTTTPPPVPHKKHPVLPDPLPFGYDLEAVRLACRFQFSTNPFLRQVIQDYFTLLKTVPCPAP